MSVQQTSLLAWAEVQQRLNERQARVLEAIEELQPVNNRQLAEHLKWPINSVTPRCLELRHKGRVEQDYVGRDITGRQTIYWRVRV